MPFRKLQIISNFCNAFAGLYNLGSYASSVAPTALKETTRLIIPLYFHIRHIFGASAVLLHAVCVRLEFSTI